MATDAVETVLLANIVANLNDATNHTEVDVFKDRVVSTPLFLPLFDAPPYCEVVPGSIEGFSELNEGAILNVSVHVVTALMTDPDNSAVTTGTTGDDDMATLCRIVRDALVRPEPYQHSPHDSGDYTSQSGVIGCVHLGTGPYEPVPPRDTEEPQEGTPILVMRQVLLQYAVEEG